MELIDAYCYEQYGDLREIPVTRDSYSNPQEEEYYHYWMSTTEMDQLTEYIAIITLDKEYDSFKINFAGISKFQCTVEFMEENYFTIEQGKPYSFLTLCTYDAPTFYYKGISEPFESFTTVQPTAIGEYEVRAFVEETDIHRSAVCNATFEIVTRCIHNWGDHGLCTKCGNYMGQTVDELSESVTLSVSNVLNGYFRQWLPADGDYYLRAFTAQGTAVCKADVYFHDGTKLLTESNNMTSTIKPGKGRYIYFTITNTKDVAEDIELYVFCNHRDVDEYNFCTVCGAFKGKFIEGLNKEATSYPTVGKTSYFYIEVGDGTYILQENTENSSSLYDYKVYDKDGCVLGLSYGASKCEFTMEEGGDVYIAVTNLGNDTISAAIDGVTFKVVCKTHEFDDAGICGACGYYKGVSLDHDVQESLAIEVGEKAYFTFQITTGDISTYINNNPNIYAGYKITLYNLFGIYVAESTSTSPYVLVSGQNPGTYYLVVENESDSTASATIYLA